MSVFLVTGASRGLGHEIVTAALAAGHDVVAGVRDPHALDDLRPEAGTHLAPVKLDVTDRGAVSDAVETALSRFGRIDVLVNNAGYANLASVEDSDPDDFRAQVDANLFGVVNLTQAVLPSMRRRGSGHIVQISSVGGRTSTPGLAAYQSAKWAVGGFSSVLAAEVEPLGIHVTVLEPGGMRTDWAGSSMRIDPIRTEYEQSVGAVARAIGGDAIGASDPAKVAQLVLQVAEMEHPPLRLLVGPDAYRIGTDVGRRLLAEDEHHVELSTSTAADDVTPEQLDPLARV
jgi:NAD(P)-dependent dehydrogenase (short-subunit alcohol dehydrogenase family)